MKEVDFDLVEILERLPLSIHRAQMHCRNVPSSESFKSLSASLPSPDFAAKLVV